MCEANAYVRRNGVEELLLQAVDTVQECEGGILLENIYGQRKILRAIIKELALVHHKIVLEMVE